MKSGYERIGHEVSVEQAKRRCLDKLGYDNRNAARSRAVFLSKKYPASKPQRPYRCDICHRYHLTTQVPHGLQNRQFVKTGRRA